MIYIFLTKGRIQLILTFCITLDLLGTQITLENNYLSKTVDFNHKGLISDYERTTLKLRPCEVGTYIVLELLQAEMFYLGLNFLKMVPALRGRFCHAFLIKFLV